ncbi:unnamed protein product [Pleuronectes platessa]|uniref:Uncharacterized protein n=1 Tax=Pleuronectes platessa TaxID=8262 RepID=A0A9N7W1H8_PLEPL|nr:unnamed protein product [Pleuronectes platessa]
MNPTFHRLQDHRSRGPVHLRQGKPLEPSSFHLQPVSGSDLNSSALRHEAAAQEAADSDSSTNQTAFWRNVQNDEGGGAGGGSHMVLFTAHQESLESRFFHIDHFVFSV